MPDRNEPVTDPMAERTARRAAEREVVREQTQEKKVQVMNAFGYKGRLYTSRTPASELNAVPMEVLAQHVATGAARWTNPEDAERYGASADTE